MIAAAQLSQFPNVTTRVVERRPGRLEIGQADGIQARSVETFQAFGFADRIIAEAYWQTEMVFWKPDPADPSRIVRSKRTPDDPAGVSEFPHLLVNQARVLDYFAELDGERADPHDARLRLGVRGPRGRRRRRVPGRRSRCCTPRGSARASERTVRAKYVIGADGARSRVREAIGCTLAGDQANHAWGVMDVLAVTDFPDIRTKCAIQSEAGNILLIPREGGHLFRMYVDLGEVAADDQDGVRDDHDRAGHRPGERDPAPLHARREERRVEQRLRGRPPPHLPLRRRADGCRGHPHPARVHRRRRLPHPQRQGRARA